MDRFTEFKNNDHLKFANYGLALDDFWGDVGSELGYQRYGYQTYRNSLKPYSGRTDATQSNGLKLADINCGKGFALKYLQEEFFYSEVHGYQPDSELHAQAAHNAPQAVIFNDSFYRSNLENYYDIVIGVNSIMNEPYPVEIFKQAYKVLKSGGRFIFVDKVNSSLQDEYEAWIKNMTNVIGFTHETHEDITKLSKNASQILSTHDMNSVQFYGDVFMDINYGRIKVYRDTFIKR